MSSLYEFVNNDNMAPCSKEHRPGGHKIRPKDGKVVTKIDEVLVINREQVMTFEVHFFKEELRNDEGH